MSDTPTQTPAFSAIINRIAMPSLLFAGSLFGLLLLSWTFLLPRFTHVERPDGSRLSPRQVSTLERAIKAELTNAEEHRMTLVRAVNDPLYVSLRTNRDAQMTPTDILEHIRLTAARIGAADDVVHIHQIAVDGSRVTLKGDVRNVGLRSMTVLAAFTDAVADLPFVDDIHRPAFTRVQLPDGTYQSPFELSFSLVP